MLDAGAENLHIAFKSICGEQWHQRLRGWEVDDIDHDLKSCGRQYVLESPRLTHQEKLARLHSLVEGVGAKLRHNGKAARGVRLYARTYAHTSWQAHELAPLPFIVMRRFGRSFSDHLQVYQRMRVCLRLHDMLSFAR